jgi:integrase/recombinase XerD
VQRFIEFPWTWMPASIEEFFGDLRSIKGRKQSTARGCQTTLRLFCSYVSDPDYGWDQVCGQRFGTHPAQVLFDWNTATHVQDNEQSAEKRAFTKRELQDFFDHTRWSPGTPCCADSACDDLDLPDGLDLHSFAPLVRHPSH